MQIKVTKREAKIISSCLSKSGEEEMANDFKAMADESEVESRNAVNKIKREYSRQRERFDNMIEVRKSRIAELQSELKEIEKASNQMDRMNKSFEGLQDKEPEAILKSPRSTKFAEFLEEVFIEF